MITSLGDIVEQHAETFPDKAAIIIQEGDLTTEICESFLKGRQCH